MRTSNERNNIGIIGIILLIANWVFVFGINSYMYDHRNENSGLLPFVWEMVAVILGWVGGVIVSIISIVLSFIVGIKIMKG